MSTGTTPCPRCSAPADEQVLLLKNDRTQEVRLAAALSCGACGLTFVGGRGMNAAQLRLAARDQDVRRRLVR